MLLTNGVWNQESLELALKQRQTLKDLRKFYFEKLDTVKAQIQFRVQSDQFYIVDHLNRERDFLADQTEAIYTQIEKLNEVIARYDKENHIIRI